VAAREVRLEITVAQAMGSRLRSDKGINFPDSDLRTPALTAKDIEDLAFVTGHADMVSYSFVHRESDIQTLRQCLQDRGRGDLAVVLGWRPSRVLTLAETGELAARGAAGLPADLAAAGVGWLHLPIPDFGTPPAALRAIWSRRAQARMASSMRAARAAARPRWGSEITSRSWVRASGPARLSRRVNCTVARLRQASSTRRNRSSRSRKCQ
jgi:hypothetical protein